MTQQFRSIPSLTIIGYTTQRTAVRVSRSYYEFIYIFFNRYFDQIVISMGTQSRHSYRMYGIIISMVYKNVD